MLAGSETKLFLLKYNSFNEHKWPISLGIAPSPRLQSLISNFLKQYKPDRDGNLQATGSEFLRIKVMGKCRNHDVDCNSPLHPLISSTSKLSTFPKFSGTFLSLEQPERCNVLRDLKPFIVLGRLSRFLQSFKFNKIRPESNSIDAGSPLIAVPYK